MLRHRDIPLGASLFHADFPEGDSAGGRLGYPTSDEQDIEGGKISYFENGSISYSIADDAVTVNAN